MSLLSSSTLVNVKKVCKLCSNLTDLRGSLILSRVDGINWYIIYICMFVGVFCMLLITASRFGHAMAILGYKQVDKVVFESTTFINTRFLTICCT